MRGNIETKANNHSFGICWHENEPKRDYTLLQNIKTPF